MDDGPWAEYARLQEFADTSILNDRAWAVDEALDALLDKVEAGESLSRPQVDNLVTNRAAKHRRRRACLSQNGPVLAACNVDEENRLLARRRLRECISQCSQRECKVLMAAGFGETYRVIANEHGVAENTIKTWVRRARLRLAV